jgi:hypothetical protein
MDLLAFLKNPVVMIVGVAIVVFLMFKFGGKH